MTEFFDHEKRRRKRHDKRTPAQKVLNAPEILWKSERIISLGEEFHPFNPPIEDSMIKSIRIGLKINNMEWPMFIGTDSFNLPKNRSLTPFNPGLGYGINSDDFTLERRTAKAQLVPPVETYEQNKKSRLDPSDLYSNKFTHLLIRGVGSILHRLGLNEDIKDRSNTYFKFSDEALDLLRRLRIIVKLPMETYEGRPTEFDLANGALRFDRFYIQEKGPLATSEPKQKTSEGESDHYLEKSSQERGRTAQERARKEDLEYTLSMEGMFLAFPNDPEVLKQISVQFILINEKPEQKTQDRGGEK